MIDSAAILFGMRLAISEYPIIGRMLVPDTHRNRLEIAKQDLAENPVIMSMIPMPIADGIVDCVSDPTVVFCRMMKYVLDVKIHYVHFGVSHMVARTGNIQMMRNLRTGESRPCCLVETVCGKTFSAKIGVEYQYIDVEDLASNTWCSRCWPKDFLEDLHEWRDSRHS